jgi:hypothetical protein
MLRQRHYSYPPVYISSVYIFCKKAGTLPSHAVVSCTHKTLHVSTTATIAHIPAVLPKEGAVISAVLST